MRAGARFTVSPFKLVRFGCVVLEGGFLFVFVSLVFVILLDPSLDNSWIYPRSQAQFAMTATVVMMRSLSVTLWLKLFRFKNPVLDLHKSGQ